jgi:hypothetical protein
MTDIYAELVSVKKQAIKLEEDLARLMELKDAMDELIKLLKRKTHEKTKKTVPIRKQKVRNTRARR